MHSNQATCWRLVIIPWMLLGCCSPGITAEPAELPLRRVVVFSTGLGYFEHAGDVSQGSSVELHFPIEDINDVLKSLVVMEATGHVAVEYDSQSPAQESLAKLQLDLSQNTSLTELLTQLRGERVRVTSDTVVEGNIVSVEARRLPLGNDLKEIDVLNLKTDSGLRGLPIYQIEEIAFVDEAVNEQFQRALDLLSSVSGPQTRTLRVQFKDGAARPVRIGYLLAMPLWKTSYRLVVDEDGKVLLQGWAHVENPTDQDWADVKLSFVSGQPISFIMDLYNPLYVQRPSVAPPMTSGMLPLTHGQNLLGQRPMVTSIIPFIDGDPDGALAGGFGGGGMGGMGGGMGGMMGGGMGGGGGLSEGDDPDTNYSFEESASGMEVGQAFRYDIDAPVTVPKQQSAMLPIVNRDIPAEKVSIFNRRANAEFPVHGVQLVNDTGLHLVAGPITVFEGGEYAGDAQIGHLRPDEKRFISYALDAETRVTTTATSDSQRPAGMKIVRGELQIRYANESHTAYQIKNNSTTAKTLIIEHPRTEERSLIEPAEPSEEAEDVYRFRIPIEAQQSSALSAREVHFTTDTKKLETVAREEILLLLAANVGSENVRQALQAFLDQQKRLADLAQQRAQATSKINDINQEQDRIRKNLERLDRNSELYRTYVKKLTEQEAEFEALRARVVDIDAREAQAKQEWAEMTATLTVE